MQLAQEQTNVVGGVACGIKAIHDLHLIHLDLKPDNVLMEEGVPKITDFSWTKLYLEEPYTDVLLNRVSSNRIVTRGWRPPEFFCGELCFACNPKADVWSFGCLALESWMQWLPFNDYTEESSLANIGKLLGFPEHFRAKLENRQQFRPQNYMVQVCANAPTHKGRRSPSLKQWFDNVKIMPAYTRALITEAAKSTEWSKLLLAQWWVIDNCLQVDPDERKTIGEIVAFCVTHNLMSTSCRSVKPRVLKKWIPSDQQRPSFFSLSQNSSTPKTNIIDLYRFSLQAANSLPEKNPDSEEVRLLKVISSIAVNAFNAASPLTLNNAALLLDAAFAQEGYSNASLWPTMLLAALDLVEKVAQSNVPAFFFSPTPTMKKRFEGKLVPKEVTRWENEEVKILKNVAFDIYGILTQPFDQAVQSSSTSSSSSLLTTPIRQIKA